MRLHIVGPGIPNPYGHSIARLIRTWAKLLGMARTSNSQAIPACGQRNTRDGIIMYHSYKSVEVQCLHYCVLNFGLRYICTE